jgi:hypothetical protein
MPPGFPTAGNYGGSIRLSEEELDRGRDGPHLRRDGKGFLSEPAGQKRARQRCCPRFIHHLLFMPEPLLKPLERTGFVFVGLESFEYGSTRFLVASYNV